MRKVNPNFHSLFEFLPIFQRSPCANKNKMDRHISPHFLRELLDIDVFPQPFSFNVVNSCPAMEPDTGGAAGPEEVDVSKAVGSHEGTRRDRRPRIDAPSSEDEAQNFLRQGFLCVSVIGRLESTVIFGDNTGK